MFKQAFLTSVNSMSIKIGSLLFCTCAIGLAASAAVGFTTDEKAPRAKPGSGAPSKAKVNYAEHIAPILNAHCAECHRPGEVAPFSLIGYENAKKWAAMATKVTESKLMP